jgi:hypothetical protein
MSAKIILMSNLQIKQFYSSQISPSTLISKDFALYLNPLPVDRDTPAATGLTGVTEIQKYSLYPQQSIVLIENFDLLLYSSFFKNTDWFSMVADLVEHKQLLLLAVNENEPQIVANLKKYLLEEFHQVECLLKKEKYLSKNIVWSFLKEQWLFHFYQIPIMHLDLLLSTNGHQRVLVLLHHHFQKNAKEDFFIQGKEIEIVYYREWAKTCCFNYDLLLLDKKILSDNLFFWIKETARQHQIPFRFF